MCLNTERVLTTPRFRTYSRLCYDHIWLTLNYGIMQVEVCTQLSVYYSTCPVRWFSWLITRQAEHEFIVLYKKSRIHFSQTRWCRMIPENFSDPRGVEYDCWEAWANCSWLSSNTLSYFQISLAYNKAFLFCNRVGQKLILEYDSWVHLPPAAYALMIFD